MFAARTLIPSKAPLFFNRRCFGFFGRLLCLIQVSGPFFCVSFVFFFALSLSITAPVWPSPPDASSFESSIISSAFSRSKISILLDVVVVVVVVVLVDVDDDDDGASNPRARKQASAA